MARWSLRRGHDLGQNRFQATGDVSSPPGYDGKIPGKDPACVVLGPIFTAGVRPPSSESNGFTGRAVGAALC